jgi:predicted  nucleic acid-binding Zn-ribbon protein
VDRPVELVPLVCIKCGTAIPAGVEEVAWACAQCGQGMYLDEAHGLEALDIHFAADIAKNSTRKPYWVADGQVTMERETYDYAGEDGKAAGQFWGQSRRFFVPAYQAPLENLLKVAKAMLLNPPNLKPGPATPFEAATLYRDDVLAAAEFIVIAIEAWREVKIKSINFELKLSKPVLWILP